MSDEVQPERSDGRVASLWRYPVKSMGGEPLDRAEVSRARGLVGDRAWAIVDVETGRVASAKQPRKWGQLLAWRARHAGDAAAMSMPDGRELRSDDPGIDATLSSAVGRAVRLADRPPRQATFEEEKDEHQVSQPLALAAPADTFFDFATIHLVTTASLARLAALCPRSRIDVARFRPNIVVDVPGEDFVENAWVGRELAIGDEVRLSVISACPRCVMITLPQGELPADPELLRVATKHNAQSFPLLPRKLPSIGVYATVVAGGAVRVGDPLTLLGGSRLRRAGSILRAIKRALVR